MKNTASSRFPQMFWPGHHDLHLVAIADLDHEGLALISYDSSCLTVEPGVGHPSMDAGIEDDVHLLTNLEFLELRSDWREPSPAGALAQYMSGPSPHSSRCFDHVYSSLASSAIAVTSRDIASHWIPSAWERFGWVLPWSP